MAGHCSKMKERHGAATRAGHLETSLNTDTGSVHFISEPNVLKKDTFLPPHACCFPSVQKKEKEKSNLKSSSLL